MVASAHVYPVYKDWLERLLAPFEDPLVGLVYGKQRGDERTKYSERQVFATWFGDQPNPSQDHPFCNNANAAVRRDVWKRLPYDETLTGLEDIAWARDAMTLGYRIFYEPAAEVVHVHDETPRRLFNRYRREAMALKGILPEERFRIWDFLRLFAATSPATATMQPTTVFWCAARRASSRFALCSSGAPTAVSRAGARSPAGSSKRSTIRAPAAVPPTRVGA